MAPIERRALTLVVALTAIVLAVLPHATEAIKVDCYPIAGATKEKCESLGCVWSPVTGRSGKYAAPEGDFEPPALDRGVEGPQKPPQDDKPRVDEPWCYHPEGYIGYKVTARSQDGQSLTLERARPSFAGAGQDVQRLRVTLRPYADGARLTIEDAARERFVPELPVLNLGSSSDGGEPSWGAASDLRFEAQPSGQLSLWRVSTGALLFSTDLGRLIFADKFLQLNSQLSSPFVYGLGEHYDPFLKWANQYKVYSFWNTDRLPLPGGTRSYGGFPFMVNLDSTTTNETTNTRAHGLYLRNSNAMDVVLQNDLSVTFRPIGGILDFFLLAGPSPLEVARQFQQLVGLPELPARWGFGFHLCRYNYNSLDRTRLVWQRTRQAGIPFDVQWNDVDALGSANDFSINTQTYAKLPEFVEELHAAHMHYIPLVDPGISQEAHYKPYELGSQLDIWIKNATGRPLVGRVWNKSGRTVFPDFSLRPASHDFWARMFVDYQKLLAFDGAWIDMNDISSFVDGSLDGCPADSALEQPPYLPGGYGLQVHSLCLSARHSRGSEYDLHNLYSSYEALATRAALQAARPNRRSVIISRSSHPGQGAHSGHWSGDVRSTWDYLRWSIASLLEHSMYGYTLVGSDICGFAGNTTPELCARWSTLGAFYTFARNHNDDTSIDQDPVALGPQVVAANKNALTKRYSLLPYLYTLVYAAHKRGEPVVRSVAFQFFEQHDREALRVESQFMWGGALMVSPVVEENSTSTASYLPKGRWYETDIRPESSSFEAQSVKVPQLVDAPFGMSYWRRTYNIALDNMPLFYRGGHVVPVYAQVRATVADTERDQPMALEVALCEMGRARGELVLDDGESTADITSVLTMQVKDRTLTIAMESDDYKKEVKFGRVKIMGVAGQVAQVTLVSDHNKTLAHAQKDHLLLFDLSGTPSASKDQPIAVSW